jgi:DNA polymerase-3 subunit alpha
LFNKFRPQNFSELIIFLALNRPGIRQRIEEIIQTKLFIRNKTSYNLAAIEETLSESYGFIIFEEQLSQILSLIYDCSFEEAEIKRREISKIKKKIPDDLFDKIKKKILSPAESKTIYQQIESAIGYTFNKAHAVAYAYLTYYVSYLKANFFPELITYLLNQKKEKTLSYLQESFFLGFEIRTPNINHSEIDWTRKDNELYMGYGSLKSSKMEFFKSIIEERKTNGNYQN